MRGQLRRWGLATALAASLIASTAVPAAAARPTDRRLQTAVDELHDLGITGVQGLAQVDGVTTRARAGVGDVERGTPVPLDGHFRMGSTSKTFIAVVVLQLVGERRLSLDDTVERWLPGIVAGNGNDGSQITVRQLLQHTSRVYDYAKDIATYGSREEFLAHRFDHYEPAELVALAMNHEPTFTPGKPWAYSNTNYLLAGMIVERVTGRSWPAEVRARIVRPLGLRHTSAPGDRRFLPAPHAHAYQQWAPGGAFTDTTQLNPSVASASSLITTPTDLARFWQALRRGELLRPRQQRQLHETVLADTFQGFLPGARYGLGVMHIPNRCGGYWAHLGDLPGTVTFNGVSEDGDRVAVLSLTTQLADPAARRAVYERAFQLVDDVICGASLVERTIQDLAAPGL
jgi:D-alanyl-D-alanine carboxypeptidase